MDDNNIEFPSLSKIIEVRAKKEFNVTKLNLSIRNNGWQGIPEPHVSIPPNSGRNFDALIIPYKKSSIAYFGSLWSAIDFKPPHNEKHRLEGPGDFELIFVVYASKFPPAESKFFLHLGKKLEDVKFYKLI